MSAIEQLKAKVPSFAKDTKINLSNWLNKDQYQGLSEAQVFGTALAVAESLNSKELVEAVLEEGREVLTDADIHAAKATASIMAMNNIYYRGIHLIEDSEISKMPARLRMTVIGNPGVEKVDFELYSLAVSAINGCGMCLKSHAHEVVKNGLEKEGVHSALRIAAVGNASAFALKKAEA